MQSISLVYDSPHLTGCDLRPDGADLPLSGQTRRVRFLAALAVPDAGITALICETAWGDPWTGYSLDEDAVLHLALALGQAKAPPAPWCTVDLVVSEADVVGQIDIEVP